MTGLERMARECIAEDWDSGGRYYRNMDLARFADLIRAAERKQAGAQRPVAWMWKNTKTDGRGVYFEDPSRFFDIAAAGDYEWCLLYAAPTAQQTAPAQPESTLQRMQRLRAEYDAALAAHDAECDAASAGSAA